MAGSEGLIAKRKGMRVLMGVWGLIALWTVGAAQNPKPPPLKAKSAILMEATTGQILFARNADKPLPPASLTKVMTTLLLLENADMEASAKASKYAVSQPTSSLHLKLGEKVPLRDLAYALMLRSANDGAVVAAEHVSGSVQEFAKLMNKRAVELGATQTHFVNPHGLHHPKHLSTARDMALIARYAMRNPEFCEIVCTRKRAIERSKNNEDTVLLNRSKFMRQYPLADGIKTGYTRQAGLCFAGSATLEGRRLIAVVLNSDTRDEDTAALMDYGFNEWTLLRYAEPETVIGEVEVKGGTAPAVGIKLKEDVAWSIPTKRSGEYEWKLEIAEARAPIERDQALGYAVLQKGEQTLTRVPVVAADSVERSVMATAGWFTRWLFWGGALSLGAAMVFHRVRLRQMRRRRRNRPLYFRMYAFLPLALGLLSMPQAQSFKPLFNGKDLTGWIAREFRGGEPYRVENGALICPSSGSGKLMTENQYEDFTLKLEFKLSPGANNGIALRAPVDAQASRYGIEIQLLDDHAPEYATQNPAQYCGSMYGVSPAQRGVVKKAGEWNQMEITCQERHVTVRLNGKRVLDVDTNMIQDPNVFAGRPGFLRDRGHIGFLSHTNRTDFRNIQIKELKRTVKENTPPRGFKALFNGKDLTGWHQWIGNPQERAKLTSDALAQAILKAKEAAKQHWRVEQGTLIFDGKGDSLGTDEPYGDMELLVDWKIEPGGDSGIYLRDMPQAQIWDRPEGSGGLFNNISNPNQPLRRADRPPGEWNRFRILMVGDKVTIWLNEELVVLNTPLENYWERGKPLPPQGRIWLQNHGAPLYFKNVYLRELKPASR